MRAVATVVSTLFDPVFPLMLVLALAAAKSGMPVAQLLLWIIVFILPPILFRLWARKVYGLDWDVKERKRRIVPMTILLVLVLVDIALVWLFGPKIFFDLFVLFFLWCIGFLAITILWTKISGHASANAFASGLIIAWYGWRVWPVLLIVPLVSWARVVRRDHTFGQVVFGALYSYALVFLYYEIGQGFLR